MPGRAPPWTGGRCSGSYSAWTEGQGVAVEASGPALVGPDGAVRVQLAEQEVDGAIARLAQRGQALAGSQFEYHGWSQTL